MLEAIHLGTLAVVLGAAAWTDVRTARIPNVLTVTGLVAGLALSTAAGSLGSAALAVGVAFSLGFILFIGRILGGGDVKLLIALGAMLGLERFAAALLLTALAGGVFAILAAARHGVLIPVLLNSKDTLASWVTLGRSGPALGTPRTGLHLPYGVPIAVGGLLAWFA